MRSTYRNLQIIKHALQYYISRPDASEKDLAREKSLLERIEDEVEYYQRVYHIPKKKRWEQMIKYCPDLTGFEIRESYLRGGGTNKTVILNHCLKDSCVAYKNGKCIKYNSNVEIKEDGDK